jgi:hypothetical protein
MTLYTHTERFGATRFYVRIADGILVVMDDDEERLVHVPLGTSHDDATLQDAIADVINAVAGRARQNALDDAWEAASNAISGL